MSSSELDTRESGPHIAALLGGGLKQAGASVAFAGSPHDTWRSLPCPANDFQAGVVISASHNPFQDNGVKLFSHAGMKFPDAVEEELKTDIFKHRDEELRKTRRRLSRMNLSMPNISAFLRKRFIPGANFAGFRIVLDCANGAAHKLGPELFRSLAATLVAMEYCQTGVTSTPDVVHFIWKVFKARRRRKSATGVAFDGDATGLFRLRTRENS